MNIESSHPKYFMLVSVRVFDAIGACRSTGWLKPRWLLGGMNFAYNLICLLEDKTSTARLSMIIAPETGIIYSQPHSHDRVVFYPSPYQTRMTLLRGGQSRLGRLLERAYAVAPFGLIIPLTD